MNENILRLIVVSVAVTTYFAASYKAGFLLVFSPKSGTQRWEIKREKIASYIVSVIATFGLFYLLAALVLGISAETFGYAFLLTFMVAFCLLYWILLKTPVKYYKKGENREDNQWKSNLK